MDVVFNALAVTFLYNLDDIGGETGREGWHQSLQVKDRQLVTEASSPRTTGMETNLARSTTMLSSGSKK